MAASLEGSNIHTSGLEEFSRQSDLDTIHAFGLSVPIKQYLGPDRNSLFVRTGILSDDVFSPIYAWRGLDAMRGHLVARDHVVLNRDVARRRGTLAALCQIDAALEKAGLGRNVLAAEPGI